MPSPEVDSLAILREAAKYRQPALRRSAIELAITAVPFVLLWFLTWATLEAGYWFGLLFAIPAGGFLLRLFLIQHDCGHGAFFARRAANDWLGRILGVVTLTPYAYWRHCHAIHHAGTGNLDNRGVGDVDTITVAEFQSYTKTRQFLYRLYRHPVVLFGLGPAYLFLLRHRLPVGMMGRGWSPWISTLGTNLGMAVVYAALIYMVGFKMFLLVHLPIVLVAASAGVWLFYVQHQFEHTRWERDADWSFHEAALHGSSNYQLPGILRWITANVGLHHVHHLVSRIPFYRLPEVTRNIPALTMVSQVTMRDSLKAVRLVLWDEDKRRLVSFREATSGASSKVDAEVGSFGSTLASPSGPPH